MIEYGAIRIIESVYLGHYESVETVRSQKRRARKPWAKQKYTQQWIEDTDIYQTPEGFICSPKAAHELRKQLVREERP